MIYNVNSTGATEALGARLAAALDDGGISRAFIALFGEMGVGKTAFVRGFCSHLNISGVRSPTYTIVNEYRGGTVPVFHFDMYRISGEDDLYSIGFDDYVDSGVCLSEWSENIEFALPDEYIRVEISRVSSDDGDFSKRRVDAKIIRN